LAISVSRSILSEEVTSNFGVLWLMAVSKPSRFLRTMNWTRERVAQSFGKPDDSYLKKIFVHISIPLSRFLELSKRTG